MCALNLSWRNKFSYFIRWWWLWPLFDLRRNLAFLAPYSSEPTVFMLENPDSTQQKTPEARWSLSRSQFRTARNFHRENTSWLTQRFVTKSCLVFHFETKWIVFEKETFLSVKVFTQQISVVCPLLNKHGNRNSKPCKRETVFLKYIGSLHRFARGDWVLLGVSSLRCSNPQRDPLQIDARFLKRSHRATCHPTSKVTGLQADWYLAWFLFMEFDLDHP